MPGSNNGITGNSGKVQKVVYPKNPILQAMPMAVLVIGKFKTETS
jgi:hypothetical protein